MTLDLEGIKSELKQLNGNGQWRVVLFKDLRELSGSVIQFDVCTGYTERNRRMVVVSDDDDSAAYDRMNDAQFIAKAPERISELVAENERLRAALETVRDPYYSDPEHIGTGDDGCPDNPCLACERQVSEAQHRAQVALYGEPS